MDKRIKVETARDAVLAAKRIFRGVGTTLIFGMPEETDETIEETVDFLVGLGLTPVFFHLTAYPGTKIFEDNKDEILAQHGTLANFFSGLDDAGRFSTNLTRWTTDEYAAKKFNMQRRIKGVAVAAALRKDLEKDISRESVCMGGDYNHWCELLASQPEVQ